MNKRKRKHKLLAALAVVIVAAPVSVAVAAGGARGHAPKLAVTRRDPFTVVGRRFTPRRRVRVTLVAASAQTRRVRANARGRFTVTFTIGVDRCTSWSVTARQVGRAPAIVRGPKPLCAPAGAP